MANPCTSCNCIPYTNLCCYPPQSGISVMQPTCQLLANPCGIGGPTVVNNPCYCSSTNKSTWSYKFFTECSPGPTINGISHFLIPICKNISIDQVTVEEKVDTCGEFSSLTPNVDFFVTNKDGNPDQNFGPSPEGFNWLKVEVNGRYDKGVCVLYRVTITGNFPPVNESIRVKAGQNKLTFCGLHPCFLVPGCPGTLNVTKKCSTVISNNTATLHYDVIVQNTGGQPLNNVQYTDTISFDSTKLTLGTPVINPSPPLNFTTGVGTVTILGTFPVINAGASIPITYDIPVVSISQPGIFTVSNTATASAEGTTSSDSCSTTVDPVKVSGNKCCNVANGNEVTFIITLSSVGSSPATTLSITDNLVIPPEVTVQFDSNSFNECTATLNGNPVPLNTDITNAVIAITCNNVSVPAGGNVQIPITLKVTSTSAFVTPVLITNTLLTATGTNPNQIFLPPDNIPATASVKIMGFVTCNNICPVL